MDKNLLKEINFKQEDKITIIGHSGAGKTTLMGWLIENKMKTFQNVYIVDTVNRFSNVPSLDYVGVTKCKKQYANITCIKLHTEIQFEALIYYLSSHFSKFFVAVDEIDRYVSIYRLYPEVKLWLEEGRNFDRGGLFTVRRVGFLNKSILGNSHYLFLFKMNIATDLDYISQITGVNVSNLQYHGEHSFYIIDLYKTKILGETEL